MVFTTLIVFAVFLGIFLGIVVWDIVKKRKEKGKYSLKRSLSAYAMISPAVILAFLFVLLPIIYSLGYAFTNFNLLAPENASFVGFENFIDIFNEIASGGELYHAIVNTALFVVCVVPLQIGMALGLALFVNRPGVMAKIFKVCFFAPVVISLSVTSLLWLVILSPSETGLLNSVLGLFGVSPQDYIHSDKMIFWIVFISAWQGCGYQMLIFLSGLTNIRQDLYEAASLDGANAWRKFTNVTWPGLRSTFVFILITVFIGACRMMVQSMLMTGYQENTVTISYYMYEKGVKSYMVGLSSSVAMLMTVFIGSITLVQRRVLRDK
jgi:fructooligosaccharide transport system permease protein